MELDDSAYGEVMECAVVPLEFDVSPCLNVGVGG